LEHAIAAFVYKMYHSLQDLYIFLSVQTVNNSKQQQQQKKKKKNGDRDTRRGEKKKGLKTGNVF
jgi:hypothetical protein